MESNLGESGVEGGGEGERGEEREEMSNRFGNCNRKLDH